MIVISWLAIFMPFSLAQNPFPFKKWYTTRAWSQEDWQLQGLQSPKFAAQNPSRVRCNPIDTPDESG